MRTDLIAKQAAEANEVLTRHLAESGHEERLQRMRGYSGHGLTTKNPEAVYAFQQEALAAAFEEIASLREEVEKLKASQANASKSKKAS